MSRSLGSVLVLLGKDLLGDHPHGLGQLNEELAFAAVVVGDTDDHAGPDLGVVAADVDRSVEVVDVSETATIKTVYSANLKTQSNTVRQTALTGSFRLDHSLSLC